MRLRFVHSLAVAAVVATTRLAAAQGHEPTPAATATEEHKQPGPADIIMPHITDSKHLELPCVKGWGEWACAVELPTWNVHVGGKTIDMGPTKHVVYMLLAAFLCFIFLAGTAKAHARHTHEVGRPRGRAAGLEALILYLRNEIYLPVLGGPGHGNEKFVPFSLALFFFILFCNTLGLLPYGATATGNLGVTAALAILTFIIVEIAGMRKLGKGYVSTVIYWPHDMNIVGKVLLSAILSPVELIGKFTKPFALTIRLFANMLAGHVIILALIGLVFVFGPLIGIAPLLMALGIMILEVLVAALQAFIFSLLAAVFIGQIRNAHH